MPSETSSNLILYPLFAMFLLVTIVFLRMRAMRVSAVRNNEVGIKYYRAFSEGQEPEPI